MKSLLDRLAEGTPQVHPPPPNRHKPWTPDDLSELRRLLAEGHSTRVIAKALGRSQESVAARARQERVSAGPADTSTP